MSLIYFPSIICTIMKANKTNKWDRFYSENEFIFFSHFSFRSCFSLFLVFVTLMRVYRMKKLIVYLYIWMEGWYAECQGNATKKIIFQVTQKINMSSQKFNYAEKIYEEHVHLVLENLNFNLIILLY